MIMLTADSGRICDINVTCADLDEICHRTIPTTDLNEFCCKSHNLPDPSIPALPSYELTGLSASCASRPMTQGSGERATAPLDLVHIDLIIDLSHATEHTCMLVLVDDHSKYVYVQPLLHKNQAFTQLKRIVSFLETQMGRNLKVI